MVVQRIVKGPNMADSIETTRAYSTDDICVWIRANRKDVPEQGVWTLEKVFRSAALTWESLELVTRNGGLDVTWDEPDASFPELRPAVIEALQALELQAQVMKRMRDALPELEGMEGIQVMTMDGLLDKLTTDVVPAGIVPTGERGSLTWQDESGASEMQALALMGDEEDRAALHMIRAAIAKAEGR